MDTVNCRAEAQLSWRFTTYWSDEYKVLDVGFKYEPRKFKRFPINTDGIWFIEKVYYL